MSEWPRNPEDAICVYINLCVCVCVWHSGWGFCHWGGKGQTPVSNLKRGHFPGVWERPWLSSSAAQGSYISNTNHTMGKGASNHHFSLLLPWLCSVWASKRGHWFLINKCSVSNLSSCPEDRFYSVFIYSFWMHQGHRWRRAAFI